MAPGLLVLQGEWPKSRAERTDYAETSRYSDVIEFVAELQRMSPNVVVENFGVTNQGRELPLVIISKPKVRTPLEAARSGKVLVLILANIHAGEVEGKEASQHLMRDVIAGPLARLLDRLILLVIPIYNADGNEAIDLGNRPQQNGPTGVGKRENAQGLDLNRDFMKLETPEARGLITKVLNRWDPHLVMDLHTTNGSYHGYALTYAPPLNPNTDRRITAFLRNKLLPEVSKTMLAKYNYRTYYYGNFGDPDTGREVFGGSPRAWVTFDHRPRFSTNYVGLRNRLAILSEAYSYLDFRTRVDVTYKFVRSVLEHLWANSNQVLKLIGEADRDSARAGTTAGNQRGFGIAFEKKASDKPVNILVGSVTRAGTRLEATGEAKPVRMIEYGEFRAARRLKAPAAYLLAPDQRRAAEMLIAHGITVERLDREMELDVEQYLIKEITRAERPFQGHRETKLKVEASMVRRIFPKGSYLVSMRQPKAALIFYLLEPESDDGLANWNFFDDYLQKVATPAVYPVYRAPREPAVARRVIPE
jgi:hypothetical protein